MQADKLLAEIDLREDCPGRGKLKLSTASRKKATQRELDMGSRVDLDSARKSGDAPQCARICGNLNQIQTGGLPESHASGTDITYL